MVWMTYGVTATAANPSYKDWRDLWRSIKSAVQARARLILIIKRYGRSVSFMIKVAREGSMPSPGMAREINLPTVQESISHNHPLIPSQPDQIPAIPPYRTLVDFLS